MIQLLINQIVQPNDPQPLHCRLTSRLLYTNLITALFAWWNNLVVDFIVTIQVDFQVNFVNLQVLENINFVVDFEVDFPEQLDEMTW